MVKEGDTAGHIPPSSKEHTEHLPGMRVPLKTAGGAFIHVLSPPSPGVPPLGIINCSPFSVKEEEAIQSAVSQTLQKCHSLPPATSEVTSDNGKRVQVRAPKVSHPRSLGSNYPRSQICLRDKTLNPLLL